MYVSDTPDKWVIVGIAVDDSRIFKVFGSWVGSYLDGDTWRMNSGIKAVTEDDHYCYFEGMSGSCYKCLKSRYGVATSYSQGVLNDIVEKGQGRVIVLENRRNLINFLEDGGVTVHTRIANNQPD